LAGSLLSLLTSIYFGFGITFLLAGSMLGVSGLITMRLMRNSD